MTPGRSFGPSELAVVPESPTAGPPVRDAPAPESGRWEVWVGMRPLVVHAYELPERRGAVFARWTDLARAGRDRRRKRSLRLRVRDAQGRLDPARAAEAEAAARALHAALLAAIPPTLVREAPTADVRPAPGHDPERPDRVRGGTSGGGVGGDASVPASEVRALSLASGFALALRLPPGDGPPRAGTGMYPRDGRPRRALHRAAARVIAAFGAATPWADLTPARVAEVWRAMARRRADATDHGGARTAELTVAALYAVARWLRAAGALPANVAVAPPRWRARLREEWTALTGVPAASTRPRHTDPEVRALFAALPGADPRIRLAVELGAGLRVGQVLRATRLDLDLAPNSERPLGSLRVSGRGRAAGTLLALTPAQRRAVDASLVGYLVRYETRFRAGTIGDYPLFPGGGLAGGVARFRWPPLTLHPVTALQLFHALEARAGVPSVRGRGWHDVERRVDRPAPSPAPPDAFTSEPPPPD